MRREIEAVEQVPRVQPAIGGLAEVGLWFAALAVSFVLVLGARDPADLTLWYLPLTVAIALILRQGMVWLPAIFLVEWAMARFGLGASRVVPIATALGATLEVWVASLLFERPSFRRATRLGPDFAPRLAFMALVAAGVGATVTSVVAHRFDPASRVTITSWLSWWLGDAGTLITFMPLAFVLVGWTEGDLHLKRRSVFESLLLFGTAALVGWSHVLSETVLGGYMLPGLMLAVVPVLWAASRYGFVQTAWVLAILTFTTFTGMQMHPEDVRRVEPWLSQRFVLQGNLVVLALAGLTAARILEAERRARIRLMRVGEEMRVQLEHIRLSQRSGRTGSWDSALDGSEMVWSDEMYVLLRRDRIALNASFQHLQDDMTSASREITTLALESIRAGSRHAVHTVQFEWPDGTCSWHAVRWEVMESPDGLRLVATHTDITDTVERRQTAEHMSAIVGSTGDAIVGVDVAGVILNWNAAAGRLFGLTPGAERGATIFDHIMSIDRESQRERLAAAFTGERSGAEVLSMTHADGQILHVNTRLLPVREASGVVRELAIVCSDLTRQHQLEQQLLQAQKMEIMGRMTSSIAHDFNNLLTGILGFAALVRERVTADRQTHAEVEYVLSAANRAASLTQRLLAFSRSRPSSMERFPVDAAVLQLEPLLRRLLSERHELVLDRCAQDAWVKLDEVQFEQVLLNLVVNARDAMPMGGRIRIETERAPDVLLGQHGAALGFTSPGVSIRVRDTGQGMDEATRERIFEPFFTTKDAGRGTGLGLSTVLAIVQDGGGTIGVQSTPGEGTCFTVLLPEVAPGVLSLPAPTTTSHAIGHGERILIVEDEPLVREFMLTALGPSGYRVEAVSSAELALERVVEHRTDFALLITDVMLSRMTGFDLAREVRERCPGMPVLLLSGHGESVLQGRRDLPFLAKPFTPEELYEQVALLIRRHEEAGAMAADESRRSGVEVHASHPHETGAD